MNWQPKQDFYSITDYLKNELDSDCKHEYLKGQVYAMAGASKNHQRISMNIGSLFREHLRNTPCDTFASDIKVKIGDLAVFYPDVIVVCEPETANDYYTEQPLIIVEVLSKSTRRVDETTKRRLYQTLPSLQEYVLIEQDIVDIEICRRSEGWQPEHYFMGDDITFAAIALTVSVNDIYERVINDDVSTFFDNMAENPY
jgi:Uma2 family endonuclease